MTKSDILFMKFIQIVINIFIIAIGVYIGTDIF